MCRFTALPLIVFVWTQPTIADDSFIKSDDPMQANAVLESDAPVYEKAKACQQLAVVGDARSVPLLARLMDHPQLSGYALTALSRIPGEQAEAAMVSAIGHLQGRQLAGLYHAIGQRRSESAVGAIQGRLASGDMQLVEMQSAIQALGSIGTQDALETLRKIKLDRASGQTKRLHADATKKCVRRLSSSPQEREHQQLDRLAEALAGDDAAFQRGLMTARKIGAPAAATLAAKLPALPPRRQALALICLADLGSPDGIASARELIEASDPEVVVRAVEAVAKLGGFDDEKSLPAVVHSKPELAARLIPAVASVGNPSIDRDVAQSLSKIAAQKQSSSPQLQQAYIRYAAIRRLSAATESLLKLSTSDDSSVRNVAFTSAGLTVSEDQFASLIQRVCEERDDPAAAIEATRNACVHLPQDQAATTIAAALPAVDNDTKALLLGQLAFLGGGKALNIVSELASSDDDNAIDAATQVLGQWTTADVAVPLLRLTDELPKGKYQLRALRGYLRVGRQLDMPEQARVELCKNGFARAQRDDERILVLDILRRFPSKPGFVWLAQQMRSDAVIENRQLSNRAFTTLAQVADRVARDDAAMVSKELFKLDLAQAPAAARETLEALR